jgi:hypothetical protein
MNKRAGPGGPRTTVRTAIQTGNIPMHRTQKPEFTSIQTSEGKLDFPISQSATE